MNIFLLEDDIIHQQRLELIIREILVENRWSANSIVTTARPDHLLEKVQETVDQNIYFLDIELNGEKKKGLEVAHQIRQLDQRGVIAFITTHSEFAPITYAYKVSAFDFIAKDSPVDEIKQHVVDCFENLLSTQLNGKKKNYSSSAISTPTSKYRSLTFSILRQQKSPINCGSSANRA